MKQFKRQFSDFCRSLSIKRKTGLCDSVVRGLHRRRKRGGGGGGGGGGAGGGGGGGGGPIISQ